MHIITCSDHGSYYFVMKLSPRYNSFLSVLLDELDGNHGTNLLTDLR
jgi:hypothetical protein